MVGSRGVSGQYVLASDGDIWNLLSGLKDEQTGMLGPYEYKKVEQLSITTTIFRISSEIRDSMNQGDDAFYPMQVSEDNLVEDLIKKLGAFSGTKLIDPIINNKPIPLFMKVAKGGESVENVLQYLCSKESNQHLVVHEGGIKEVDKVLLDLASCVYLAFSGLSYSLISSGIVACLTKETKNLIYNFLEKVNDDDFMSISVGDGKLIRFDKEYVANDFFAKSLSEFVEECNVLEVDLFDVPEWASSHKDVLGVSCYSSIKASISESIPLFLLDNTLCQLCAQESISVVDSSCFIMRIQKASRKDFFRDIECFLEVGLPVPLSWERVFRMATQLGEGQKLVSKLIVSNNFIEYEKLTSCLLLAVGSNYSLRRSAFYKYSFYIVNACLENVVMKQDDGTSEDRISSFLFVVFVRLSHTNFPVEFYNQVYLYVSEFIRGHFMNEEYIWKSLEEKLKASL